MNDEEFIKTVDWRHDKDKLREKVAVLQARVKELEDELNREMSYKDALEQAEERANRWWQNWIDMQKELVKHRNRVKELESAIGEVLDGTLPYLAEKRLKAVLDEVNCK